MSKTNIDFSKITDAELWLLHEAAVYRAVVDESCESSFCAVCNYQLIHKGRYDCDNSCPIGDTEPDADDGLCSLYRDEKISARRIVNAVEREMRRRDEVAKKKEEEKAANG